MNASSPPGKNELAVVTGAGHRLGRAIAAGLARLGYAVGVHYHASAQPALETCDQVKALGQAGFTFQADLSQPQGVNHLFEQVDRTDFPLGVLVHSAGIMLRATLDEVSVEDWDRTMDLNLRAAWLCGRLSAERMQAAGGTIINISDSGAGRLWMTYPAYSISKAGVEILTRMMAKAYAPAVRVNAVAPGLVLPPEDFPTETWDKLVQRLPLKRPGSPDDVVGAIEYLLANPYITGHVLVVDGGYQLV